MADTVRVYNIRKYNIGVTLQNNREYDIKPGGFVTLSRDDVEYIASVSPKLFEGGKQLVVENKEFAVSSGFISGEEDVPLDDVEIKKHLNLGVKKLEVWLSDIEEPYLLDAIYDIAMTMDLPSSKLKVLQEKMPSKEFLNIVE